MIFKYIVKFSLTQVGSDHRQNCSSDTRVLFCTTGVLVEKIIHGDQHNPLDQFTHIILDEVHERDKGNIITKFLIENLNEWFDEIETFLILTI